MTPWTTEAALALFWCPYFSPGPSHPPEVMVPLEDSSKGGWILQIPLQETARNNIGVANIPHDIQCVGRRVIPELGICVDNDGGGRISRHRGFYTVNPMAGGIFLF